MKSIDQVYLALPEMVIITDVYWYILDFNKKGSLKDLKKGIKLTRFMPDCKEGLEDEWFHDEKVYQRKITSVYQEGRHVAYTVYLADITEKKSLVDRRRHQEKRLKALIEEQKQANRDLEELANQAEALSQYGDQVRIARRIHDDFGHTITLLHTISQMCLQLKDGDLNQYHLLLDEGLALCRNFSDKKSTLQYASIAELMDAFCSRSPFPLVLQIEGDEPAFSKRLYDLIYEICKEAYHNMLSHSLADQMHIKIEMTSSKLTIRLFDNGSFRGPFKKGFGLTMMEEKVRTSGGLLFFHALEGEGFGIIAEWREENG